jgi:hypothetical protein
MPLSGIGMSQNGAKRIFNAFSYPIKVGGTG